MRQKKENKSVEQYIQNLTGGHTVGTPEKIIDGLNNNNNRYNQDQIRLNQAENCMVVLQYRKQCKKLNLKRSMFCR